MSGYQSFFHAVFILLSRLFMPRYDTRLQLLSYQVQMLRNRIADSKIIPTETERAELIRLGTLLENDITDVMLVVQPAIYRRWLRKKCKRECLNHFICITLKQLDHINREWLAYYHNERPHQGTDIGNKVLRPDFTQTTDGEIKREQRLGGVISWYYRDAA